MCSSNILRRCLASALFLAVVMSSACAPPNEDLPAEVLGRWVTTETRYADRFFELDANLIRMGTGGSASELYPVVHVTSEPHPRGRLFKVMYAIDDSEVLFAFHFDAAKSSIRLLNQPGFAWTRGARP